MFVRKMCCLLVLSVSFESFGANIHDLIKEGAPDADIKALLTEEPHQACLSAVNELAANDRWELASWVVETSLDLEVTTPLAVLGATASAQAQNWEQVRWWLKRVQGSAIEPLLRANDSPTLLGFLVAHDQIGLFRESLCKTRGTLLDFGKLAGNAILPATFRDVVLFQGAHNNCLN